MIEHQGGCSILLKTTRCGSDCEPKPEQKKKKFRKSAHTSSKSNTKNKRKGSPVTNKRWISRRNHLTDEFRQRVTCFIQQKHNHSKLSKNIQDQCAGISRCTDRFQKRTIEQKSKRFVTKSVSFFQIKIISY